MSSFNDAFVMQTMLTCIGNKRKLVHRIMEVMERVRLRTGKERISTMDAFTGSTVVARAMTSISDKLYVNDQEEYSYCMARCFLETPSEEDATRIQVHIMAMNELARSGPYQEGMICRNYAPKITRDIQEGERCFYTRENALIIDTLRHYIATHVETHLQHYCLAPLLTKASIHTNTAGVFKGFYKGRDGRGRFGGEAENALSRIMKPIEVEMPIWNRTTTQVHVMRGDIHESLLTIPDQELDLIYLDPPYNIHPYGSNYFMLNVILKNEEPEAISKVSGIPTDWRKSIYNKKATAIQGMRQLLCQGLQKSTYLLISYNNEGFIEEHEWEELLAPYPYERFAMEYDTFKGSRNLRERSKKVTEYLYLVSSK
jgi:adenine-specific DNA-methyltransferase